jgi:hypothetical protein
MIKGGAVVGANCTRLGLCCYPDGTLLELVIRRISREEKQKKTLPRTYGELRLPDFQTE